MIEQQFDTASKAVKRDAGNNRWELLAFTRFLLASVVAIGHLSHFVEVKYVGWYSKFGSFTAIMGFLLISGYSIGASLKRNQSQFYQRRVQRIFPVYIASIVLTFFALGHFVSLNWGIEILANLLLLNQLFTDHSYVGGAWSLSVEFWFYLVAPLLLRASSRVQWLIVYVSFGLYCLYTCGRSLFDWPYYNGTSWGLNFPLLLFLWVAGFNYCIYDEEKAKSLKKIGVLFFLNLAMQFGILFIFRLKHNDTGTFFSSDTLDLLFQAAMFTGLWFLFRWMTVPFKMSSRTKSFFLLLGNISYPLYLVHIPTYHFCKKWGITNEGVFLILAFLLSILVYYLFDSFLMRIFLKKRLSPKAYFRRSSTPIR